MIAAGYDGDRRPLVDVNRSKVNSISCTSVDVATTDLQIQHYVLINIKIRKAACLDVRFASLKNDLLDMTGSALGYCPPSFSAAVFHFSI
jgi:hypothetical protein